MPSGLANGSGRGMSNPLNVDQITKRAQEYDYNPLIPLRYYLRAAASILKEAAIYEREGNDEQAYLLLFRHAQLVLAHLVAHPESREPGNRAGLIEAQKDVKKNLARLEVLKPRINKRHDRFVQLMHEREERRTAASHDRRISAEISPILRLPTSDPALAGTAEHLEAGEHKDLAVRLAQQEITRRATARKATRQAGISQDEEQQRRSAGVWGNWEEALSKDNDEAGTDDLSRRLQDVRSNIDAQRRSSVPNRQQQKGAAQRLSDRSATSSYNYPTVPPKSAYETWSPPPIAPSASKEPPSHGILKPQRAPDLPPKDFAAHVESYRFDDGLPPRPDKISMSDMPSDSPSSAIDTSPATSTPPSTDLHPSTFTFKPSAYLENGSPLRTIFLPPDLRNRFLSIAASNTNRNLETCGILCGTLVSNALFISKLVIPEQESTSDTCETVNESALVDYCDSEDLMVLGWIHTHPTQTCFMSSRDLHTHCGYQVMMPESIAIVCAPSKGEWGIFRLTDPPGMKAVLNCHQTGLFHPHAESNIYTDALRPGHVFEAKGLEFECVDLRPSH